MHHCPICGRAIKQHQAYQRHLAACLKRPDDAQLIADYGQRDLTIKQLAAKYDVSRLTISNWLTEAGIGQRKGRRSSADHLTTYPQLAPLRRDRRTATDCPRCPGLDICRQLLATVNWILCEAPDALQMHYFQNIGVDIQAISTAARATLNLRIVTPKARRGAVTAPSPAPPQRP
jgi:hypothetical protein